MPTEAAKGKGTAFDAQVEIIEFGDPLDLGIAELERLKEGHLRGYETQLADAVEAVDRAKRKLEKAQATVAEVEAAVWACEQEVAVLTKEVAAAKTRVGV